MVGRRYDFVRHDDLASLCDMQLIVAYSEWVREESDEDDGDESAMIPPAVADIAKHLSKVASPFLEGRALNRAERLARADNAEARREAQRLREEGAKLKAWA